MKKSVIIVGGGIIGLMIAYYLKKSGHEVLILDQSTMDGGASYVNAGYISPSHIVPLASPGMINKGLKWMFDSSSPFYIKPRLDVDFLKWAWHFKKACNPHHVEKSLKVIRDINLLSKSLFEEIQASGDLGDFQLEKKGLLMLFKTQKEGDHEAAVVKKAVDLGLDVFPKSISEIRTMLNGVEVDALGGFHYECDGHMTPTEFMEKLKNYLVLSGVKIMKEEEVLDFECANGKVHKVITQNTSYDTEYLVLASGSWSENLAKKLKLRLPMQAGKGYKIDGYSPTGITIPTILMERKVAVTPMSGFTRFAGTMEFSGINTVIIKERVLAIAKAASQYFPDVDISNQEINAAKSGLRPVSPDGLPYIGKINKFENIFLASGHAMMGWSLGPATGKLIAEIVDGQNSSLDLLPFDPHRFG
ncbi:MAG TPA: FAD-dependent oxidoreductase [Saprospiraceae bacterium]|nr:FAD-dependent oxidoreductase [Saprospiraceae bacterium]